MTRRRLYVFALWLPLLALVLIAVGEAFLKQFWWHSMSRATGYFLLSGVLGGIQYLLFAAAITWRFARMSETFLARITWVLPVMFFPLCILGLWFFFETMDAKVLYESEAAALQSQQDILAFCIRLGIYSVFIGYAYVICVHLVAEFLYHLKLMREE